MGEQTDTDKWTDGQTKRLKTDGHKIVSNVLRNFEERGNDFFFLGRNNRTTNFYLTFLIQSELELMFCVW